MLGEQVWESTGRTIGTRVLPGDDYRYIKMESTFEETGTLLGAPGSGIATIVVFERVPGQLYAEGQGILVTEDGESAIWNGHGVGTMTGEGLSSRVRFSIAVQAGSTGRLARLNSVLIVGEQDVDAEGNAKVRAWEWK